MAAQAEKLTLICVCIIGGGPLAFPNSHVCTQTLCYNISGYGNDNFYTNEPKPYPVVTFLPLSFAHHSVTDFHFVFLIRMQTPLSPSQYCKMYGLSYRSIITGFPFVYIKFGLLCFSMSISLLRYYLLKFRIMVFGYRIRFIHTTSDRRKNLRRKFVVRSYLFLLKYSLRLRMIATLLLSLLLLCGDVHPHPGPALPFSTRHPRAELMNIATWNVRTLLDRKRRPGRPTAIVAHELARYNIDVAALSETRVLGDTVLEELGAGYTFFLKGKPVGCTHQHGVGFAVRTKLVKHLQGKLPVGINERLMTMNFPLADTTLSIISAYAPTLPSCDESKEQFYGELDEAIKKVPAAHKLLVLGDFNARVGSDYVSWENVLGRHGVGNVNSNGTLLLSLCAQNELVVTNTIFQQRNRHKTTWMHPGSKEWHMIDFVITRQRDINDVNLTRSMCGSCAWSDHKLVKCKMALQLKAPQLRPGRQKPHKKLDTAKLKCPEVADNLTSELSKAYSLAELSDTETAKDNWEHFRDVTLDVAQRVLGSPDRKHRDWFDENDKEIKPLLNQLHDLQEKMLENKSDTLLAGAYKSCKQNVQFSLRSMQNSWWEARAEELQSASDRRDYKSFYQGLKAVYGPSIKSNPAVKSKDDVIIHEPPEVLDRWAEHFQAVLNQDSVFDMSVLEEIPQEEVDTSLDDLPTLKEVQLSIKQLSSGKCPGEDGIPPEIYKHGGEDIAKELLSIFVKIWNEKAVLNEFRDCNIIHLYKGKGDRLCCDNHRGISLLSIAGKILGRILLNRLIRHVESRNIIPESQCGFRANRGTADMVFALRLLQEKCKLKNQDLYLLFIDLTKAFDTVNREGLWCILEKAGCPKLFVTLIRSFHDDMKATVREGNEKATPFDVTSGTKQGCVLAPTLFSIFFSAMLSVAFKDCIDGVDIVSRFDRNLFDCKSSHFNATSKVSMSTIRDLLFADDCALAACSLESLQHLCDNFASAARRFGLTISIKKTEAMYQPPPGVSYEAPVVTIDGARLNAVSIFKYLGGIISNDASIDAEITSRISRATVAFGRLTKRLWLNRNVRFSTKISVYRAAVITSLLYGCETWTLKRKHIICLEKFHQSCIRKIARIRWFHKVTNYEVLERCNIPSALSMVESSCLRWTGHVVRMDNSRIPKALLYGRLSAGTSRQGNHKTYSSNVKSILRSCDIDCMHLETEAENRTSWRSTCKIGILKAEANRTRNLVDKRERRKARADLAHT